MPALTVVQGRDPSALRAFPRDEPSSFVFRSRTSDDVLTYIQVPASLSMDSRLAMVMHGTLRNADEYIAGWADWASRTDHVIVAPCFDRDRWPGSQSYNLGNVFSETNGRGELLPVTSWSFSVVEAIHECVRTGLGLRDDHFAIWGHSAGAQFVHRLLLFRPRAKVRVPIAAGAGWFTAPDLQVRFPYGLRHRLLSFTPQAVRGYVRRPLTIMRGALDTLADADLRQSHLARAQGSNRYERAGYMHRRGQEVDPDCGWRLIDVPGVGHDWARMALAAQSLWEGDYLRSRGGSPERAAA